jgi:hypothetical protein
MNNIDNIRKDMDVFRYHLNNIKKIFLPKKEELI